MISRFYCLRLLLVAAVGFYPVPAQAQNPRNGQNGMGAENGVTAPNYRLAGRFAPYNIRDLIHTTAVAPRWIDGTDKFWYQWDSSDGTTYYIVDPAAGTKREVFDNDRIAAELTRIT
ncbi:MAG: S9 family peptidase, partial [Gemmatimonadales bacterium]